ncbi:MAG: molybdopterin-dependent oxidoreductase [Cyanobacteria bacterium]|nr:molybdopterin-dependent oxidoreductase [Cyanobacteriota bacterium]
MNPSRREILGTVAAAGAATLVAPGKVLARLAADGPCAVAPGELLGLLPLFRGRPQPQEFGIKYGGVGLDARLVTDLSTLEPHKLITPNDLAYIRTEMPAAAAEAFAKGPWTLDAGGLIPQPATLTLDDLTPLSKQMGPYLFECSGNANPANFGLMSVAEWEGIPLVDVVARLKPAKDAAGVLVSGFDHIGQNSQRSIVGASWVYPLASLDKLGAFLAIRMNGEPVPADHGRPVRLVVPGWYGCTWIKWVNEIRLVGPDEPATTQMVEFANRTHQAEPFKFARDYAPADIQTAATPIRVEKRKTPQGLEYRIVGIVWGGKTVVDRLQIRFGGADQPFTPFQICPAPKTHTMWQLWEYRWKPEKPGTYDIALEVADQSVPQRRLKSGYYMRQVKIDEI